jgi:hypothetical protein
MSFVYPRTIEVRRPNAKSGEGALSYGGQTQSAETVLATGIMASIQLRREGQRNTTGLPGDGTRPNWDVFTPRTVLADGLVQDRDIVVDDLGRRFQVLGDYIDSMGGKFRVERLEA